MATQTRGVVVHLDSALVWPHLEQCVLEWGSPLWRNGEKREMIQRRRAKMGLGAVCGEAERPRKVSSESEDLGRAGSCSPRELENCLPVGIASNFLL